MSKQTRLPVWVFFAVFAVGLGSEGTSSGADVTESSAAKTVRVVIITGDEHGGHNWRQTAPFLRELLAQDKRLEVVLKDDPAFLAAADLDNYDAIVLNYKDEARPEPGPVARANLARPVKSGKGLVLAHFASGAFQQWPEFVTLAGRIWDPQRRPHDPRGSFHVDIVAHHHPICRGLSSFETDDELYTCLAGDTPITVLATAKSKVDGQDYPMAFVLSYGQGKVFHCALGHDVKALTPAVVQQLYRNGTAFVAGLQPMP